MIINEDDKQAPDTGKAIPDLDEWRKQLPERATACLQQLEEKLPQLETFDLLSNISFYNHLANPDKYEDNRGDKMFFISELIAMLALKKDYVRVSSIEMKDGPSLMKEIQAIGHQYYNNMNAIEFTHSALTDQFSMEGIADKNRKSEMTTRNPGIPELHFHYMKRLYAPLEHALREKFGFSIKAGVQLLTHIMNLINKKYKDAIVLAETEAIGMAMEVFKYRATKSITPGGLLSEASIIGLNKGSRKHIKESCYNHCINRLFFYLGRTFCFTAQELSDFSTIDIKQVSSLLQLLSIKFPGLPPDAPITGPAIILKEKPLLEHEGRYLAPSFPLLAWSLEPIIEEYIKQVPRLQDKFTKVKHDFLMDEATTLFTTIFKGKAKIHTNLYYPGDPGKAEVYETDMIFIYERTLFIVEGKGNRFTQPAKEGKIRRTETHLKQIVKESYEQGLRTLTYIKNQPTAKFYTKKKTKISFTKRDFDDFVIISLALEPIGSITPLIRTTNELGFFERNIFPFILSIYDLAVIADHFELPILFLHYIKRRKKLLESEIMHIFDETDLIAYYLYNRLYTGSIHDDAIAANTTRVQFASLSDNINDYYVKRRLGIKTAVKAPLEMDSLFLNLLHALDTSDIRHKKEIMLYVLDLPPTTASELKPLIEKTKSAFYKEGRRYDCAVIGEIDGVMQGLAFMAGPDINQLNIKLFDYLNFKLYQGVAKRWLGIGDIARAKTEFNIVASILAED